MNLNEPDNLSSAKICGCCEGLSILTPAEIDNRPGLKAIAYRVGTHEAFKKTMLALLSSSKYPELKKLTTREDDDFSIALIDAWAVVSDVLTFYQERIANESYLRTASERFSILQLARLTGYELGPGLAASAYLAFTVEDTQGFLTANKTLSSLVPIQNEINIEKGIKVQSVPVSQEQPQIFETIEDIPARPAWNEIRPRLKRRHTLTRNTKRLFIEGTAANLKKGDGIAFHASDGDGSVVFGLISEVTLHPDKNNTEVALNLMDSNPLYTDMQNCNTPSTNIGATTSMYLNKTFSSAQLNAEAEKNKFRVQELFDNLNAASQDKPEVYVFRTKASIFGHNAPEFKSLPISLRGDEPVYTTKSDGTIIISKLVSGPYKGRENTWPDEMTLQEYINYRNQKEKKSVAQGYIHLDTVYQTISNCSYVILKDEKNWGIYSVKDVAELSLSDFMITSKVAALTLSSKQGLDKLGIRKTSVFACSELLTLADQEEETIFPYPTPFPDQQPSPIELNGWIDGLYKGQKIVVYGEKSDMQGVRISELAVVDKVEQVVKIDGCTRIWLKKNLKNSSIRSTVFINANVALATHGETVSEILGSGDSGKVFQSFILKQTPLTYISASTPSGVLSTLEVRVNDLLWKEVTSLFSHGPDERIYIVRIDDNGKAVVQFGDGHTGARLPTGRENIRAQYRKGSGLEGLVMAAQLKLLMTRPYGIKEVINPIDAEGADEQESLDNARLNTPLKVLTLDRVVSLRDYEDFARSFTGIAKAFATWTWDGQVRGVFITVAGPKGAEIKSDSNVHENLINALARSGDPSVPIIVKSYKKALVKLSATIKIATEYSNEKALSEVKTELLRYFSFDFRDFGQAVSLSEVMALIQSVSGVKSVDVDTLVRSDGKGGNGLQQPLPADLPKSGSSGDQVAAELLVLDEDSLVIGVIP